MKNIHPVRAIIAIGLVGGVIYQAVVGGQVSAEIATLAGVAVTFYFTSD